MIHTAVFPAVSEQEDTPIINLPEQLKKAINFTYTYSVIVRIYLNPQSFLAIDTYYTYQNNKMSYIKIWQWNIIDTYEISEVFCRTNRHDKQGVGKLVEL